MKKGQLSIFQYAIKNVSDDEVDIYIDGDIVDAGTQAFYEWFGDHTTTSYKSFREQLDAVDAKTYNVYINSGGGMVTDAMAIHDLIKSYRAKGKTVNTIGRGIVASAATYILMAGEKPRMSKNSWFMIHNVSGYLGWADVDEMQRYYNTLRKFNDRARDFYAEATGKSKDDIEQMMKDETWMTADEAKKEGFIKVVEDEVEFTNAIPKENWVFDNQAVLTAYNSSVRKRPADPKQNNSLETKFDDMKKFLQQLGENILNAIKGVQKPEDNNHEQLMQSIGTAVQNAVSQWAETFEPELDNHIANAVKDSLDPAKNEVLRQALENSFTSNLAAAMKADNKDGIMSSLTSLVDERVKNLVTQDDVKSLATKEEVEAVTNDVAALKGKPTSGRRPDNSAEAPIGTWVD